ncbi:hypothetical protein HDV02_002113 [Globomyces sp. JEL0801]|nr:hypothetical protein HDV02_002113 [Globomyces sp. JEL0801]
MDDTISGPTRNEPTDSGPVHSSSQSEFRYLLEKSQQLFVGLRELPPTGRNWPPHFQRTFEVYTRLWKFQQQHRAVLENKDYYDLKRWEIGELASKIAINERNYFKDVLEAKNPALMVKKLRYYARFIVVCLLLNRNDMIKKLMDNLSTLVEDYNTAFKPNDYAEWNVVLSEISTFLEAEKKLAPVDFEGTPLACLNRLKCDASNKYDKEGLPKLRLQEAILVGNYQNQIKFSELTLDMYRILQSLEREPSTMGGWAKAAAPIPQTQQVIDQTTSGVGMASIDNSRTQDGEEERASRRSNPRKYLLYRPAFAQLALYISTCFKDISEHSALLLYISADGSKRQLKGDVKATDYVGGIATAVNYSRKTPEKIDADQNALTHTLHPQDLVPFTRKPMFVIVDSNNSVAFKDFPKVFNQPFVCLMSPVEYPSSIKDTTQIGSLFSLFLHCPVKAFAFISDITQLTPQIWEKSISIIEQTEKLIADLLDQDESLGI